MLNVLDSCSREVLHQGIETHHEGGAGMVEDVHGVPSSHRIVRALGRRFVCNPLGLLGFGVPSHLELNDLLYTQLRTRP